jgi:hypothetical protein
MGHIDHTAPLVDTGILHLALNLARNIDKLGFGSGLNGEFHNTSGMLWIKTSKQKSPAVFGRAFF